MKNFFIASVFQTVAERGKRRAKRKTTDAETSAVETDSAEIKRAAKSKTRGKGDDA